MSIVNNVNLKSIINTNIVMIHDNKQLLDIIIACLDIIAGRSSNYAAAFDHATGFDADSRNRFATCVFGSL